MSTTFVRLNADWNADPNAPEPEVERQAGDLTLTILVNAFVFPQFVEGTRASLVFRNCWRHRLGPTNDEGWYQGQCRFSGVAPAWGEFYQVEGDLVLGAGLEDWVTFDAPEPGSNHYLFYLRDATFECDASSLEVYLPPQIASANAAELERREHAIMKVSSKWLMPVRNLCLKELKHDG